MFSYSQRKYSGNNFSEADADSLYMRRCLRLAANGQGLTHPNPMVGAVIVHDGHIIGEGWHHKAGQPHAEPNAINSVKNPSLLCNSTLYVSLEPCSHYGKTPPCADLIIEKKIPRVVIGCTDPFPSVSGKGIDKLINAGIEVKTGVEEKSCLLMNRKFFTFHLFHRPYILLKWAQTRDGFMDIHRDSPEEKPLKISDSFTSMLVHRLRADSEAIIVGNRTQYLDQPQLNVRHWPMYSDSQPLKIVMRHEMGDLQGFMNSLYEKNIQSVLVEGGSSLLSSFIALDLWDEIQVETAPHCIGRGVAAPGIPFNKEAISTTLQTCNGHSLHNLIKLYKPLHTSKNS